MKKILLACGLLLCVRLAGHALEETPPMPAPLAAPLPGDPMGVTIHRLPNGLTVYLSPYHVEPRITAWIIVRAGSKDDPPDATGMAHYLEHMLFKGSANLGTIDYQKEKPLLDRILALYEKLFAATDPAERKALYKEIDRYNVQVSTYAVPNELAQAYRSMGMRGFNAFTADERTIYICDIPSNRAKAWAKLESDRFSRPVFRLFQTEIETVYEEKNRSLDNAERIIDEALDNALWKTHPYGRTVLGSIEHLKNPSLAKMYAFYEKHYIPNNMAIALSGDFDRQEILKLVEESFGGWKAKPLPPPKTDPLPKPKGLERVEVRYEAEEKVYMAWRTVAHNHADADALTVMDMLMDNSAAGIINLDLLQAQKVKTAGSYPNFLNEAGAWVLWAVPKKDQKLEEAEALLMATAAKLKAGEFTDEDIQAVVTNFEIDEKYRLESNESRAGFMAASFSHYEPWTATLGRMDRLRAVTKADVLRVAARYLGEDRVVAYRRQGRSELPSIAKPEFTKLDIKPQKQSKLFEEVVHWPIVAPEPRWISEGRDYTVTKLPQGRLYAAANPVNDLFSLTWHFDVGMRHERHLCAALDLLDLSGAGRIKADDFKKKLYSLGTTLNTSCSDQESSVSLSGLEKNLWPSLELMNAHFSAPNIASGTLKNMVEVALGSHQDNKKDPNAIHHALAQLAMHGRQSHVLLELSDAELRSLQESRLLELTRGLFGYKRRVAYVGTRSPGELARLIDAGRRGYKAPPAYRPERYLRPGRDKVFFVHRDMLQSQVGISAGDEVLDTEHAVDYQFLANYLGGGMSSLVFQEVRESRALAYAASGGYVSGSRKGDENELWGYLGTQADKTLEAARLLRSLLRQPPLSEKRLQETAHAIEAAYRTNPIKFRDVPGAIIAWEDQGLSGDPRPKRFERALKYRLDDLARFAQRFENRPMTAYILGNRDRIKPDELKMLGDLEEKTLDQIFPY